MNERTDSDLLRSYAERHSETAFEALVRRHAPLVLSAALRMTGDPHLAQDVTQRAFLALALNARALSGRPVLAGWLHRTARNIAMETIRNNGRRRSREQEAAGMQASTAGESEAGWDRVAGELDELMDQLKEGEKEVLLARFFENQDLRRIGEHLGISEDAAQKRVSRALDRLREMYVGRGISISAASLGAMVAANAVQPAPAGLISCVCGATSLWAGAQAASAITPVFIMSSVSKSLVIAVAVLAGGVGIYEAHRAAQLRGRLQESQVEQAVLRETVEKLTQERDDARRKLNLAAANDGGTAQNTAELLRLRNEVTELRGLKRESASARSVTETWEGRIQTLRRRLDEMPGQRIPEMAFLSEKDWAAATRDADLTSEVGLREALKELRSSAKGNFLEAMRKAMRAYVADKSGHGAPEDAKEFSELVNANSSYFPKELSELKQYLMMPVEDSVFERYEFTRPAKLNEWLTDILVREVAAPADEEYDTRHEMGLSSGSVGPVNRIAESVLKAKKAYAEAHGGSLPDAPEQVGPFLSRPLPPETVRKYLDMN